MAKPSVSPEMLTQAPMGGAPGGFNQDPAALVPKPTTPPRPIPVKPTAVPPAAAPTAFNPNAIDPRNGTAAPPAMRGEQIQSEEIDPLGELGLFLESLFSGAFGGQSQAPAGQTWDPLLGYVPEAKSGTPSRGP